MNRCSLLSTASWLAIVVGFGLAGFSGGAQALQIRPLEDGQRSPRALYLKQGVIDTTQRSDLASVARQLVGTGQTCVLQLDGPMDPVRRARLEAGGVEMGDYLPINAYVAGLERADVEALADLEFVRWIGPFRKEWKIDPGLGQRLLTTARRIELGRRGLYQVVIVLFQGQEVGPALADMALGDLRAGGATVLGTTLVGLGPGRHWMIDATVAMADVGRVADLQAVQFIEEAPEVALRNDTTEWILQSNEIGQTPVWDAGIQGQGQIGGIIDGTIRESHCSFDDSVPVGPSHRKLVALRDAGSSSSHGTHVAGTMAGDAGTHGMPDQYDGIAYAARISFSNVTPIYSTPTNLYPRLVDAHNDGARLHSNSWGDDYTTQYTTWCQQIDQFSYE